MLPQLHFLETVSLRERAAGRTFFDLTLSSSKLNSAKSEGAVLSPVLVAVPRDPEEKRY